MIERIKTHPLTNVGTVLFIFLATIIFSNSINLHGQIISLGISFRRLFDGLHGVILLSVAYAIASLFKNKFILLLLYLYEILRVSFFVTLGIENLKLSQFNWSAVHFLIAVVILICNYLLYMYAEDVIALKANLSGSFLKRWTSSIGKVFNRYGVWLLVSLAIYFLLVLIF
ncbi:hypothetical protein [Apilactobacillus xinyiensis]|uniref:hypothetical protein n=1 Tax=Apilactobacillus xinyiensis TaxID=2841032 RepID=UPI001C7D6A3F|nr:hypothetical protein [Apilactobacillus xinyiensis]